MLSCVYVLDIYYSNSAFYLSGPKVSQLVPTLDTVIHIAQIKSFLQSFT